MSRMRKLSKKKEGVKTAITGLVLSLAIGGLGSLGSYAYFTAKAEVNNSLKVKMGTFDVNKAYGSGYSKDISISSESRVATQKFVITNDGSLDQYLKFGFSNFNSGAISNDVLSKLGANLIMKQGENVVKLGGMTIDSLNDLDNHTMYTLVDKNDQKFKLKSGESIECTLFITISENLTNDVLGAIQNKEINFKTEAESIQINAQEGGNK